MSGLLTRRWVSAPALWGKLPTHADYVRHRVASREDHHWQQWLQAELGDLAFNPAPKNAKFQKRNGIPWASLDYENAKPSAAQVPIAFVLAPEIWQPEADSYVIGAIARSQDKLGRQHPLIVYQFCSTRWLRQCFASPSESLDLGWLYWLCRVLDRFNKPQTHDSQPHASLPDAVDALWKHFEPTWLQATGIAKPAVNQRAISQWFASSDVPRPAEPDLMQSLSGVRHLPWPDWPGRLWQTEVPHLRLFWQYDAAGGYVGASGKLPELWS